MKTIITLLAFCLFLFGSIISQTNLDVEGDAFIEDNLGIGGSPNSAQLYILQQTGERSIWLSSLNFGTDLAIRMDNGGGTHYIFDDADDGHSLEIESANDIAFNTGGPTEAMRINDQGRIAINDGISNILTQRFRVQSTNDLDAINILNSNPNEAFGIYCNVNGAGTYNKTGVNATISGPSGTGILKAIQGIASPVPQNSWAVYASGDMWYTGNLKAPSDIRLKKNVQDIEPVLEKLMQLQTKTYEFDHETYHYANLANGVQHGFIAQNVQELFPTLVEEEKHSFTIGEDEETGERIQQELNILGMSSIEMIPILTKAIQEQQDIIEDLKSRIETLENE